MMNHFFAALIILGIIVGAYTATADAIKAESLPERLRALETIGQNLTEICWQKVEVAVTLCIGYIGLMALWLGLMKIAEDAGLVRLIARALRPIMRLLFPAIPTEHPAMGAMLMNIAANMLGLDNAATPLGLKAMKELQTLNPVKETATDGMIMFLAINTSSVTVIPFSIIAFRATADSINPQIILGPALLATTCSTIAAVTAASILAKLSKRKPKLNFAESQKEES